MIHDDRIARLVTLIQLSPEGVAEENAVNEEEKELVAQMRLSLKPVPGMIVDATEDFEFDVMDSPDFDFGAWVEAGRPKENLGSFVKKYKPKPYGWIPNLKGEKSEM